MSDSDADAEVARETDAFLTLDNDIDNPAQDSRSNSHPPPRSPPSSKSWLLSHPKVLIWLLVTIKFSVVTSGMIIMLPVYRLVEDAFCHIYYQDSSPGLIDELKCKNDDIQSKLAYYVGWSGLLTSALTLLIAFPYGMLADRIGRKPTALLSYAGLVVSFMWSPTLLALFRNQVRSNPYILLVGALFLLCGGGVQVFISALYAMAADISTEENRAANFLYMTIGSTAGGLVGPLISGTLMKLYGPWVPILLVFFITPFLFALFIFIPETMDPALLPKSAGDDWEDVDGPAPPPTVIEQLTQGYRNLYQSLSILRNINVLLVLVTFLVQNARITAYLSVLAQYISKHFGWKIADISFLLSPMGVINLLVLAALPRVSDLLISRFGFTVFRKDLYLTRISTGLIIVGGIVQGFSGSIIPFLLGLLINTLGAADSPLARATISHYVEPQYTSRLFALIGMVEISGAVLGGPVLAWLFDKGLQNKGLWIGLPWLYVAALHVICFVCLNFVRAPKTGPIALPSEDEENPWQTD